MQRYLLPTVFLICLLLLGCSGKKSNSKATNQDSDSASREAVAQPPPINPDTVKVVFPIAVPADFELFYKRFHLDTAYQRKHIGYKTVEKQLCLVVDNDTFPGGEKDTMIKIIENFEPRKYKPEITEYFERYPRPVCGDTTNMDGWEVTIDSSKTKVCSYSFWCDPPGGFESYEKIDGVWYRTDPPKTSIKFEDLPIGIQSKLKKTYGRIGYSLPCFEGGHYGPALQIWPYGRFWRYRDSN
jgi:hypothetical protein